MQYDKAKTNPGITKKVKWGELGTCANKTANTPLDKSVLPPVENLVLDVKMPSKGGSLGTKALDGPANDMSLSTTYKK